MKNSKTKIFLLAFSMLYSLNFHAQSLSYTDFGILASQENYRGTARFNAMSGAFGALGGDVSSIYINPAGGAVFINSVFSGSISKNENDIISNYYDNKTLNNNSRFRASQFGAVFVHNNTDYKSSWNKFAIGLNYAITNDFTNNFSAKGNNNFATFVNHPYDNRNPITDYENARLQSLTNDIKGYSSAYTFSFSAEYEEYISVGASINLKHIDFVQNTYISEKNNDNDGNTLFADYSQYLSELSNGVSLGIGIISKPYQNLRLGLAYQSPTWYYDISEESNITDNDGFEGTTVIDANDINDRYTNNSNNNQLTSLKYKINTPSKLTGSAAYIFNQNGLISIDYTLSDYTELSLEGSDFSGENTNIQSILNNKVNTIKIGTEWRLKQWSFRGGYSYKENPYSRDISKKDIRGFSLGMGVNMNNTKFDISYENSTQTGNYDFYGEYNQIAPVKLDTDQSKITATLSFTL